LASQFYLEFHLSTLSTYICIDMSLLNTLVTKLVTFSFCRLADHYMNLTIT